MDMFVCAFACLNRGGLIYLSILLFIDIQCSHSIFNKLSSSEYSFIKLDNQKQTLVSIIEQYISNSDDVLAVYYTCEECETTLLTYLVYTLGCVSNLVLNNYSKIHTVKLGSVKQSGGCCLYTIKINLYITRFLIGTQCSSCSITVALL